MAENTIGLNCWAGGWVVGRLGDWLADSVAWLLARRLAGEKHHNGHSCQRFRVMPNSFCSFRFQKTFCYVNQKLIGAVKSVFTK